LFETQRQKGCHRIVSPENSELKYITLERIVLDDGENYEEYSKDQEVALTILGGRCDIDVDESLSWKDLGGRPSVFEGLATAAYIPRDTGYSVKARGSVDIMKAKAPVDQQTKAFLVRPEDVVVRSVGALNWKRDIRMLIDQESPSSRLIIGETLDPPGGWASYPPHKHDVENPPCEARLEEVYFFLVKPTSGFGVQVLYTPTDATDPFDEAYVLRNGCAVVIPRGYHPVVAAPGYTLYYFWAMAGERKEFRCIDDPQHSWIKDMEPIVSAPRP